MQPRVRHVKLVNRRGFTLLEVLVALAVLAIAMAALIKGGTENARSAAYLRDKTMAQWVAMNVVAKQRLETTWPATGKTQGSEEMAKHEWFWVQSVSETFDKDVRRVEVTVRDSEDKDVGPLVNLVAFLPRPMKTTTSSTQQTSTMKGGS